MIFLGLERPVEYGRQQIFDPTTAQMVLQAQDQYANALYRDYVRGLEDMKEFNKEYGNFITPILADQEWYNKNVIDKVRGTIQRMYDAGIDPTRSVQGRAAISQLINSIDVGSVNKLRSSAANAEEFLKARRQLEAQGLYNPLLAKYDGPDINTYSTLDRFDEDGNVISGSGVWDKMSPTPYHNMADFSKAYYDNISPIQRSATKNGVKYTVSEITESMLQDIANRHFNDLVQTPQGQMMYKYYKDTLGSDEAARQAFNSAVVSGNLDRLKYADNYNEMDLKQKELNLKQQSVNIQRERLNILKGKQDPNDALGWTGRQKRNVVINNEAYTGFTQPLQKLIKGSTKSGAKQQLIDEGIKNPTDWQIDMKIKQNKRALGNYGMDSGSRSVMSMNYRAFQTPVYGDDAITAAALAAGLNKPESIGDINNIKRAPMTFLGNGTLNLTNIRESVYAGLPMTYWSGSRGLQRYMEKNHVSGHMMYPEHVSVNYNPYGNGEHNWDINTTIRVPYSELEGYGSNVDKVIENAGGVFITNDNKKYSTADKKSVYETIKYVDLPVTRTLDSRGLSDAQIDTYHDAHSFTKTIGAKRQGIYEGEIYDE